MISGKEKSYRHVGIGTTTPNATLDVYGSWARIMSGSATSPTSLSIGRTSADVSLGVAGAAGQFSTSAAAGDVVLRTESSSAKLHILNGSGTAAISLASGNVGIGTTSPSSALQVNGTITASAIAGLPNLLSTNGYQTLPGGLIIQWGHAAAAYPLNVTFPLAFPNSVYSIILTPQQSTGGTLYSPIVLSKSLTGFTADPSSGGGTKPEVDWIAIGR